MSCGSLPNDFVFIKKKKWSGRDEVPVNPVHHGGEAGVFCSDTLHKQDLPGKGFHM